MPLEKPDAGVQPGQVLAGKYRVERVLGAGAMGVVVAATHLELDELVALKFLAKTIVDHPDAIARFSREARAAAKIKCEHVARVSDVGRLESGAPYLVMEYLRGTDVEQLIAAGRPLPIDVSVGYLLQACEAIAEAHGLGIIHRDLKPANLFVARRPDGSECLKVLDFGISKVMPGTSQSGRDAAMTHTAAVMGTPLYMSPEQMNSPRDAVPRSDIWSLGAILYELLIGRPPFDAESLPQLAMMIVHREPPPMIPRRPDVPPALEAVVRRCLEKDLNRRFANVAELAAALAPFSPAQGAISAPRAKKVLLGSGRTDAMPIVDDRATDPRARSVGEPSMAGGSDPLRGPATDARVSAPTLAASSASVALSTDTAGGATKHRSTKAVWAAVIATLAFASVGVVALIVHGGVARSVAAVTTASAPAAVTNEVPRPAVAASVAASIDEAPAAPTASETASAAASSPVTAAPPPARRPPSREVRSPPPVERPEAPPKPKGGLFDDRN
jgi:serine/threonine-protein kinase